jgi:hypothetical protein
LIHNAGEFAVEKYESIAKDKRAAQGIVQVLDKEVIRIVAGAQPRAMERSSITRPSSHIGNSPGRSHIAHHDAGAALNHSPQGLSQSDGGVATDLMDLSMAISMPMRIADDAWSPALADEIGWDWGDFSQLFTESQPTLAEAVGAPENPATQGPTNCYRG